MLKSSLAGPRKRETTRGEYTNQANTCNCIKHHRFLGGGCIFGPACFNILSGVTRYEKLLLLLFFLALALQVAGVTPSAGLLWLSMWLLGLSYLLGGRWLFPDQAAFSASFYVIAGVCFGTSLISMLYTFRVQRDYFSLLLPVLNALFCAGLGFHLLTQKGNQEHLPVLRGLWLRSVILFGIAALFAYTPIVFTPYRAALLVLNRGDEGLTNNLLMHDYELAARTSLDGKDCNSAIDNARAAYASGNRWLAADSVVSKFKISGLYTLLYEAYDCQGDADFAQKRFALALKFYRKGNWYLVNSDNRRDGEGAPPAYWEEEKAWSMKQMADCYLKLRQFEQSDSLYMEAVRVYKKVKPVPDVYKARLAGGLAKSFAARMEYGASTKIYRVINQYLATDTTAEAIGELTANKLRISFNYIQQDSLPQALRELQAFSFSPGDTAHNRFDADTYRGICLYKMGRYGEADRALRKPWEFYKNRAERSWEALAATEILLAKNSLARGAYPQARVLATAALARTRQKMGAASSSYAYCLSVVAALNKSLGQYAQADQQFRQALAIMRTEEADGTRTLPELLAQMAELNIALGREPTAKTQTQEAMQLLLAGEPVKLPSQTGILVTAAYVDYVTGSYSAAQTKYRQVLAVNNKFGQAQSANSAVAWNGLGILATTLHQPARADSLLQQAVAVHEALFTKQHPLTGQVYLNYGQLRLRQGRLPEAATFFQQALGIAQAFLPNDHDSFGDLAMAFGNLAQLQREPVVAQAHYQRALDIYNRKFGPAHWKTRQAQQKIRN